MRFDLRLGAVRRFLLHLSLLSTLAGCRQDDAQYRHMRMYVERDVLTLSILGPDVASPCPPSLEGTARINGIPMEQEERGGGDPLLDSDDEECVPLKFTLEVARLPPETETLDVTFDTLRQGEQVYEPSRSWHVQVDWSPEQVWSDDDLAARMHASEEFEVRWTPADLVVPELHVDTYLSGVKTPVEATATLVHSEPGTARYRFDGPEPSIVWGVVAIQERRPEPTRCEGFKDCSVQSSLIKSLHPGGISPTTADGVAPPRTCIAAPGATGAQYRSPSWTTLPDLSALQIRRDDSCARADLYFVVLGACGVCGGGKSTYVIGNRGTRAASFRVRSNKETLEGGVLEPQQRSEPFEIAFDGELSAVEIVTDDDCDPASNRQWVGSVVCTQIEYARGNACLGFDRFPEWAATGMCRVGQEDNCNNLCGGLELERDVVDAHAAPSISTRAGTQ